MPSHSLHDPQVTSAYLSISSYYSPHYSLSSSQWVSPLDKPSSLGFKNVCNYHFLAWKDICLNLLMTGSLLIFRSTFRSTPWKDFLRPPNRKKPLTPLFYFLHCMSLQLIPYFSKMFVYFFLCPWDIRSMSRTLPIWCNTISPTSWIMLGHGTHCINICWVTKLKTQGTFCSRVSYNL